MALMIVLHRVVLFDLALCLALRRRGQTQRLHLWLALTRTDERPDRGPDPDGGTADLTPTPP